MSQSLNHARHDPLKWSLFFIYPEKSRDLLVLITRIALLLCLATSIPLVLYVAFSTRSPYFSTPSRKPAAEPDFSSETNISHILFGIGGSTDTYKGRRVYSSLWWVPGVTRGFVWLERHPTPSKHDDHIGPPYQVSDPGWIRFKYSSSRSAVRIARIIWDSFNLKLPNVRWFVMGDDDTVYFAENLVSVLAKYDHRQMWYIGGSSESVEQDVMHSFAMAFGGGGFALSYPLAEKLVSILDGCLDRYWYFYGSDQRIFACISEIGVPLTKELGFHQFDIRGDSYGLLAAHPIAPLVSLHHIEAVAPIFPNKTRVDSLKSLRESYRADPSRILQQTFCYDPKRKWSFLIAWGYTIQVYPSLLPANDLQVPLQTFKTWRSSSDGPFTFNTRPMPQDPCQQPVIYFLDRVEEAGSGTRTSYKRTKSDKSCSSEGYAPLMAMQRITVSSMKTGPDYWQKAPQRQCCQIMDSGSIRNGNMSIRIRNCRKWEATKI